MNLSLTVKNVNRIKSGNNNKHQCDHKNPKEHRVCEKGYVWNPAKCSSKNGKYILSITGNSVVKCDDIIDITKDVPTKSIWTEVVLTKHPSTNFYILLVLLLNTIALLIALATQVKETKALKETWY